MRADFYWILFLLITKLQMCSAIFFIRDAMVTCIAGARKGKREMEPDRRAKCAKSERLFHRENSLDASISTKQA